MNSLTPRQIVAIGVGCLFGIPICVGLITGFFLGVWSGVVIGVLVFLFIVWLAQRWLKRQKGG